MRSEMEQYRQLVEFLAETLGNTFEAGLFDLTDPSFPLVTEANAYSDTHERVRELIISTMHSPLVQSGRHLANFPINTDFDKLLKVSVYFIWDPEKNLIGALWISMRCDLFLKMENFAMSMLQFSKEDPNATEQGGARTSTPARELSLETIAEFIREFSETPTRMTMNERQEVICDLYDMGVYNLKGAVAKTAEVMQISEQSVYRYIAKLKKARDW